LRSIIKGGDGNGTSHFFVFFFMFKVKAHALRETKTEQYYCVCVLDRVHFKQKRLSNVWRRANTLEQNQMMNFWWNLNNQL
jgi:hypothetical protein